MAGQLNLKSACDPPLAPTILARAIQVWIQESLWRQSSFCFGVAFPKLDPRSGGADVTSPRVVWVCRSAQPN
jgi:hypothetical protein